MPRWYFEDLMPGQVIEASGPTITAAEIIDFARQFDPQYFHVDPEAARRSPFGQLIASGWHTTALCMRMVCDGYLLEAASLGSPGVDELRWTKPVCAGDTLRLKMIVQESRPSRSKPDQGSILSRWEIYNQRDELVMHMTGWGMFKKRNA